MTKVKPKPVSKAVTRAIPCPPCGGTGRVKVRQQTFSPNGNVDEKQVEVRCVQCGGSGRWYE